KILEQHPDREVSWISEDGKKMRGTVAFEERGPSRTLIHLSMSYQAEGPDGGRRLGRRRRRTARARGSRAVQGTHRRPRGRNGRLARRSFCRDDRAVAITEKPEGRRASRRPPLRLQLRPAITFLPRSMITSGV